MKADNPPVDSNPEEVPDDPDKSKEDHSDEQKKNLFPVIRGWYRSSLQ